MEPAGDNFWNVLRFMKQLPPRVRSQLNAWVATSHPTPQRNFPFTENGLDSTNDYRGSGGKSEGERSCVNNETAHCGLVSTTPDASISIDVIWKNEFHKYGQQCDGSRTGVCNCS